MPLVQAELLERGPVDGGDEHVLVQLIVSDELGVEGRNGGFRRTEAKLAHEGHGQFLAGGGSGGFGLSTRARSSGLKR